jgi:hypothetical protein
MAADKSLCVPSVRGRIFDMHFFSSAIKRGKIPPGELPFFSNNFFWNYKKALNLKINQKCST